jgi:hypothetical protein
MTAFPPLKGQEAAIESRANEMVKQPSGDEA